MNQSKKSKKLKNWTKDTDDHHHELQKWLWGPIPALFGQDLQQDGKDHGDRSLDNECDHDDSDGDDYSTWGTDLDIDIDFDNKWYR